MKDTIKPYTEDELFIGEDDPNLRCLCHDANKFYRDVMGLQTPITKNNMPKSKDIQHEILNNSKAKTAVFTKILHDLRATSLKDIFPNLVSPPPTFIGVLWHAVHEVIILPEGANVIRSDVEHGNFTQETRTSNVVGNFMISNLQK